MMTTRRERGVHGTTGGATRPGECRGALSIVHRAVCGQASAPCAPCASLGKRRTRRREGCGRKERSRKNGGGRLQNAILSVRVGRDCEARIGRLGRRLGMPQWAWPSGPLFRPSRSSSPSRSPCLPFSLPGISKRLDERDDAGGAGNNLPPRAGRKAHENRAPLAFRRALCEVQGRVRPRQPARAGAAQRTVAMLGRRPRCAVLAEQRYREFPKQGRLDALRPYLARYNCFPPRRDPETAPIRMEELKQLVRKWKLHHERNFWRNHPTREDVVLALTKHLRKVKERERERAQLTRAREGRQKLSRQLKCVAAPSAASPIATKDRSQPERRAAGGGAMVGPLLEKPAPQRANVHDMVSAVRVRLKRFGSQGPLGRDLFANVKRTALDERGMIYFSRHGEAKRGEDPRRGVAAAHLASSEPGMDAKPASNRPTEVSAAWSARGGEGAAETASRAPRTESLGAGDLR